MKTNQLMDIAFSHGNIQIFHNTAMGDLNQLWNVGCAFRIENGKSYANLNQWIKSKSTNEFIEAIEKKHGIKAYEITGKGKNKKTYACIQMMIYAAEFLDVSFHLEVIDTFINNKILEYRDSGGDKFKALNLCIDNHLSGRKGKSNKGIYIQVSKMIREKCQLGERSWNAATAEELRRRDDIEDKIAFALGHGLINDWEHLKDLINSM
ncbi:hypothetical protein AB832_07380 [Flavobacteriaceae bacterium (ex Bugula neritina AB1)]|nr:hypothetical protein AB832_07380 [Flavobacteriaceae bacterium (ex Bugula neritina AB1)]